MNTSTPKVSVIIPTYNREKFIGRAIESVLAQTYKNFEIVVVDDGSTDNTRKALEPFDGKIKYIYQENGGSSSARNRGLQESTGEYIAFLDSDDTWTPNKLAVQLDILDKNKHTGIVYSKMLMFNEKGERIGTKPDDPSGRNFEELIEISGDIPTSSVLTRRECFDKAGLFDENLPTMQDFDMWLRISEHYDIYEYEESLAYYYRHNQQNTSSRANCLYGLVLLNRKILKNYGHLPNFPHSIYRLRIASNEYWLSRAYYDQKKYSKAFKYLLVSIFRCPLVGLSFAHDNEIWPSKVFKVVKTYAYLVICGIKCIFTIRKQSEIR
jgi:glycosyltransferase involved in cell wall biosynthesis